MPQSQNAFNSPDLFNPFMAWTDLAMKTTEAIVSSGQAISDRVDQVARAGANSNAQDVEPLRVIGGGTAMAVAQPSLDMFIRIQTTHLELVSRLWQQLFANLGAFSAFTPRRGFMETLTQQMAAPALEAAETVVDVEPKRKPAQSAASAKRPPRAKTSSRAASRRSKAR